MATEGQTTRCPQCGKSFGATVRICPDDGTVLEQGSAVATEVGKVLEGKYRLDAFISKGGMGAVYRASHIMLGKTVAVKLINQDLVTSPEIVRRFQREARAATALNHPNIVGVYDMGQTSDGTLYIAMEFINGPSLKSLIDAEGPLSPSRTVVLLRQVASALAAAHRQEIVHRDLKPHNIMLARTDDGHEMAKLVDFGIAKTFDESTQLTMTGFVLGTPQYMAPEQAEGRPVDGRSDLYSLGVIMYEMLTGVVPFSDQSAAAILIKHIKEIPERPSLKNPNVQIPPELESIALRCLEKDPARRFQTADEFAAALNQAASAAKTGSDAATLVMPAMAPSSRPIVGGMVGTQSLATMAAASDAPAVLAQTKAPATTGTRPTAAVVQTPNTAPAAPPPAVGTTRSTVAAAQAPELGPPPLPAGTRSTVAVPPGHEVVVAPSTSSSKIRAVVIVLVLVGVLGLAAFLQYQQRPPAPTDSVQAKPSATEPPAASPAMASPAPPAPPAPVTTTAAPVQSAAAEPSNRAPAGPVNPAAAASRPERTSSSAVGQTATTPTRPSPAPPRAPSAAGAAVSQIADASRQAPPPAAFPESPAVFFHCVGANEICAPLRTAMDDALDKAALTNVRTAARADIDVAASVEGTQEKVNQQFGTTFAVRTYSIQVTGEARSSEAVPMPSPTSVSFDPQFGSERAAEKARLVAGDIVDRVKAFARKKRGG